MTPAKGNTCHRPVKNRRDYLGAVKKGGMRGSSVPERMLASVTVHIAGYALYS